MESVMKTPKFTFIFLSLALLASSGATHAFSVDNKSGNNPDGTPRFADPDENTPDSVRLELQQNPEIQRQINNR